jgi:hypothetical protein
VQQTILAQQPDLAEVLQSPGVSITESIVNEDHSDTISNETIVPRTNPSAVGVVAEHHYHDESQADLLSDDSVGALDFEQRWSDLEEAVGWQPAPDTGPQLRHVERFGDDTSPATDDADWLEDGDRATSLSRPYGLRLSNETQFTEKEILSRVDRLHRTYQGLSKEYREQCNFRHWIYRQDLQLYNFLCHHKAWYLITEHYPQLRGKLDSLYRVGKSQADQIALLKNRYAEYTTASQGRSGYIGFLHWLAQNHTTLYQWFYKHDLTDPLVQVEPEVAEAMKPLDRSPQYPRPRRR